jgi:hypothetical protein
MKPEEEYEWAWEQSIYDKEDGRLWILEMNTALIGSLHEILRAYPLLFPQVLDKIRKQND